MILTGPKIIEEVKKNNICISPFNEEQINPNSYDFRLGNKMKIYKETVLDPHKENETDTIIIPKSGMVLYPETLYLAHSEEAIGSNYYVPILRGKSSTGRLGIYVHITADLIDIGSCGQFTLMMHVVQPVRIYPHMLIGQVTFWKPHGDIELYDGKYQNSRGPQASQIHVDRAKL